MVTSRPASLDEEVPLGILDALAQIQVPPFVAQASGLTPRPSYDSFAHVVCLASLFALRQ